MIRVYFENWMLNKCKFYPIRLKGSSLDIMIEKIAQVAGVQPIDVKIYFIENKYLIYSYSHPDPKTDVVFVRVEGKMEKTFLSKGNIVSAVCEFLTSVGLDKKPEIIIHPYPSEKTVINPDGGFASIIS